MLISVILGDISKMHTDAIVNAANTSLLGGGIHRAASPGLLAETRTLGGCESGKAKITRGYDRPATYVIHTPGPVCRGGAHNEDAMLASCYRSCLELAELYECATIAFPLISTGVYGFPLERAARIAIATLIEHQPKALYVQEVIMVLFDERTKQAYDQALSEALEEQ